MKREERSNEKKHRDGEDERDGGDDGVNNGANVLKLRGGGLENKVDARLDAGERQGCNSEVDLHPDVGRSHEEDERDEEEEDLVVCGSDACVEVHAVVIEM